MPKISQHSYDIAVVAVRRDHTCGVSVLKVYQPWLDLSFFLFRKEEPDRCKCQEIRLFNKFTKQ